MPKKLASENEKTTNVFDDKFKVTLRLNKLPSAFAFDLFCIEFCLSQNDCKVCLCSFGIRNVMNFNFERILRMHSTNEWEIAFNQLNRYGSMSHWSPLLVEISNSKLNLYSKIFQRNEVGLRQAMQNALFFFWDFSSIFERRNGWNSVVMRVMWLCIMKLEWNMIHSLILSDVNANVRYISVSSHYSFLFDFFLFLSLRR